MNTKNPFDVVNYILTNKSEEKGELYNEYLKNYNPYLINKALAYHIDTVMYSNEMNIHHNLDNYLQFDYLNNSVKKYKRQYKPWHKKDNINSVGLIKHIYNCNTKKAETILGILTFEQLNQLEEMYGDTYE